MFILFILFFIIFVVSYVFIIYKLKCQDDEIENLWDKYSESVANSFKRSDNNVS